MQFPLASFPHRFRHDPSPAAPAASISPPAPAMPAAGVRRIPGAGLSRRLIGAAIGGSLLCLAACGGGGGGPSAVSDSPQPPQSQNPADQNPLPPPPNPESGPEAIGVFTGFTGDPGWIVTGVEGDGGIGGGADGDGGVGAGGSLGRFRNAIVTAWLDDGRRLGPALTHPDTGMVTIRPGRRYAGSLLVELAGQAGSEYFDEARNAWIPFPAGQRLRTLVPAIRANIGLTPFTEAAAALADNDAQLAQRPPAERAREANERVRRVANSLLPTSYAIDDLIRLPVLIGPESGRGALPDTPGGRLGTAIAALAFSAAQFNPPLAAPGHAIGMQLANDLADGVFNGVGPAASPPADQLAYSVESLPGQLVAAIDQVNSRYGVDGGDPPLPSTVAFGRYVVDADIVFNARLLSDGTVLASLDGNSDAESPIPSTSGLPGADLPATALFSDGAALFVRRSDGRLHAIGTNRFANAQVAFRFGLPEPEESSTLVSASDILGAAGGTTDLRFGARHVVARTASGAALAWGDNTAMQVGIAGVTASVELRAVVPNGVRAIAASNDFSLAHLADGRVLSWGSDRTGGLGRGANQVLNQGPGAVLRADGGELADVVSIAASFSTALALRTDGTVWGWGSAGSGLLGDEAQGFRYLAAPVNGLAGIRKMVPGGLGMVALDHAGVVYQWGAAPGQSRVLPSPIAGLPPIRDIQDRGAGVTVALGFGDEVIPLPAPGGGAR